MLIGIIGWLIAGLLVGFVAAKLIDLRGDDPRLGIGVAVVGAFVGGFLHALLSGAGVTAFNRWSMSSAALGAAAAVAV